MFWTEHNSYRVDNARVLAGLLLTSALFAQSGCRNDANKLAEPIPPTVSAANPLERTVTLFIEENGETEPVERAVVSARVSGFLEEIHFEPGDWVDAGALLYTIEQKQYLAEQNSAKADLAAAKATVLVAEASKASSDAELNRADRELARQRELLDRKAVSQSEFDSALAIRETAAAAVQASAANIESAAAEVQRAQAILEQADLNFEYTTVKAPIAGYITKSDVKVGNLVQTGDSLATLVNTGTIFANFSVSDSILMQLKNRAEEKRTSEHETPDWRGEVVLLQRDPAVNEWITGGLEYVDQEGIDADTGTFGLRAVFTNENRYLIPGMFVRIRIPLLQQDGAIVIPEKSIRRSSLGTSVLVVKSDATIEERKIALGQIVDGWAIAEEGLSPNDQVVIEGLQRARPGSKVNPNVVSLPPPTGPAFDNELDPTSSQRATNATEQQPESPPTAAEQ